MKKLKSEVNIDFEDENGISKEYTLRYDLNALDAFEELYNKSLLEVFGPSIDDSGNMIVDQEGQPINIKFRVGMIRDLIWVGLIAYHPEITRKEVGAMFDVNEANEYLLPKITEALALSNRSQFPVEKITEATDSPPKK